MEYPGIAFPVAKLSNFTSGTHVLPTPIIVIDGVLASFATAKVGDRESMIRAAFLTFWFLLVSTLGSAQSNCPEGFNYAGTLSGSGSPSSELNRRETLRLPENAKLDDSFQQKNVRATNRKSGAHSSMTAQDVPKGLLIIPHGKSDKLNEQGWAVSDPKLKALGRDSSGKVTQYEFGMKLFCNVGKGPNPMVGDCSVDVDVCYRPSH